MVKEKTVVKELGTSELWQGSVIIKAFLIITGRIKSASDTHPRICNWVNGLFKGKNTKYRGST